jgi:hypothetical protein
MMLKPRSKSLFLIKVSSIGSQGDSRAVPQVDARSPAPIPNPKNYDLGLHPPNLHLYFVKHTCKIFDTVLTLKGLRLKNQ